MKRLSLRIDELKFTTSGKTTNNFRGMCGIYLRLIKEKPEDHNHNIIHIHNKV